MFAGLIVAFTIVSALGIGILAGWGALSLVLFAFSHRKQATSPRLRALTQTGR
ncbi:MAG: hypothetical protein HYX26_09430 [Acidobacteriales bacterium]|nr:hypothetical protein [Terriglobales bacterium]